jgi:hypothetical protein
MKGAAAATLATSLADIAAGCPSEKLSDASRYVIVSDLRMGDCGKHDELAIGKKALFAILGRYYLPRGYTLVLNGDIEDLRSFWLKDILSAWPEMYALFDAFKEKGRLHKIVGERDLALLRLSSYPYGLSHGLRLEGEGNSILVLHGHQASPPFFGRAYLSDYMIHWLNSAKRAKAEDIDDDKHERFKAERRLYRASSRLGIVTIQGHTCRPLFKSLTNRDSIRADPSSHSYDKTGLVEPCLFSSGRIVGSRDRSSRGLRMLELGDGNLSAVRWSIGKLDGEAASRANPALSPLEGTSYQRIETRVAKISGLFDRVALFAPRRGEDNDAEADR